MNIKKLFLIFVITLLPLATIASELRLSDINEKDKKEALKIGKIFFNSIETHNFENIKKYLISNNINLFGQIWLPTKDEAISFLKSITSKDYKFKNIDVYNFDDCIKNENLLEEATKYYKVFDNYSLMITANYVEKTESGNAGIILVNNNGWKIYSIFGLGSTFHMVEDENKYKDYNKVVLKDLSFEIQIPKLFKNQPLNDLKYNYIMAGETQRDSTIQIVNMPQPKESLLEVSYNWVMHNLKNKKSTNLIVRRYPNGFWYESNIKADDNIPNKMIILAVESEGKYIFINFFSLLKTYNENFPLFYNLLNSVKLIN